MAIMPYNGATVQTNERFWRKVDKSNTSGCWPWIGGIARRSGYGRASSGDERKSIGAHRKALELKLGRALTTDEHALHADGCVKACCNPDHLRLGTHQENMADITRINDKRIDDANWDLEIASPSPRGLEMQEQIAPFFAHLYPQRVLRQRPRVWAKRR